MTGDIPLRILVDAGWFCLGFLLAAFAYVFVVSLVRQVRFDREHRRMIDDWHADADRKIWFGGSDGS